MAFGPMEMAAVALGAMFRDQIGAIFTWPFRKLWLLVRKARPSHGESGTSAAVAEAEIIDVTPIRRTIR